MSSYPREAYTLVKEYIDSQLSPLLSMAEWFDFSTEDSKLYRELPTDLKLVACEIRNNGYKVLNQTSSECFEILDGLRMEPNLADVLIRCDKLFKDTADVLGEISRDAVALKAEMRRRLT